MREISNDSQGASRQMGASPRAAAAARLVQVSVSPSKVESDSTTCPVNPELHQYYSKLKDGLINSRRDSKPSGPYN